MPSPKATTLADSGVLDGLGEALNNSVHISVTDARGRILFVSDKFLELYGFRREEVLGETHRIINSGYHSSAFFVDLWETIARGRVWEGDVRNRTKDGKIVWSHLIITPVRGINGQVERHIAVRHEVTERKQAEAVLRGVAEGVSGTYGTHLFRSISRHMVEAFGVTCGCVALLDASRTRARTLAHFKNGAFVENASFDLKGEPGAMHANGDPVVCMERALEDFPDSIQLRQLGADSYVGAPLLDSSGKSIGFLSAAGPGALKDNPYALSTLQVFAMRAAVEVEREEVLSQLRRSEEQYRVLLETVPFGIQEADLDGHITYSNSPAHQIHGYTQGELIGKSFSDLLWNESDRRLISDSLKDILTTYPIPQPVITQTRTRDGRKRDVRLSWNYRRDEKGAVVGFVGAITDITERLRTERQQTLQNRVSRVLGSSLTTEQTITGVLRALCEEIGYDLGILWVAGGEKRFLRFEGSWLRPGVSGGVLMEDIQDTSFSIPQGMPGHVWLSGKPLWVSDISTSEVASFQNMIGWPTLFQDLPLVAQALRSGFKSALLTPVKREGKLIGVISLSGCKSMTPDPALMEVLEPVLSQLGRFLEHRRTEEQLRQSQKMDAIGRLSTGIAHNFNNIVAAISATTELIKRNSADREDIQKLADQLLRTSRHAADVTQQLLSFVGRGHTQAQTFEVNDIITDVLTMVKDSIAPDISVQTNLADPPLHIYASTTEFESTLINLIRNACDAMPNGGALRIDSSYTMVLPTERLLEELKLAVGEYIRIDIADTGVGMDEEVRNKIFEPFFTTKPRGRGTGLGLFSAWGYVRGMGGAIRVQSHPGEGTIFTIYIPLVTAADPSELAGGTAQEQIQSHKAPGGYGVIMLVEDDEILREAIARQLEDLGHEVITCEDGREALAYYNGHSDQIDLVILDLLMPHVNGDEVYYKLKEIRRDVTALLITGTPDAKVIASLHKEGLRGVLAKPFKFTELSRLVGEILPESD